MGFGGRDRQGAASNSNGYCVGEQYDWGSGPSPKYLSRG